MTTHPAWTPPQERRAGVSSERLSEEQIQQWFDAHAHPDGMGDCQFCDDPWPCYWHQASLLLQETRTRLAAIEAERDALVQAIIDAPGDAIMMAIDLGTREKFPRSGAFHLEDPMHVIWKAVYEATMAHDARTKGDDSE